MKIVLIILAIIILTIIVFLIYRSIAFRRESKQANQLKFERLQSLYEKLQNNNNPTTTELEKYASDNKTRFTTYEVLTEFKKENLFPKKYYTIVQAAESNLVNWLEFPTELGVSPDEIEYMQKVIIDFDNNNVIYHVFKFRVDEPHWAGKDGWLLGVVGPYFDDSKPYDFPSSTFSRLSKLSDITPKEEVDWVHKNISLK